MKLLYLNLLFTKENVCFVIYSLRFQIVVTVNFFELCLIICLIQKNLKFIIDFVMIYFINKKIKHNL
jgi:hypothetical protein